MDDHVSIERLKATLVEICKPHASTEPEIVFTQISDDATLLEIRVGLKPATREHAADTSHTPRTEMVLMAETLISLFEETPGFQHWRHPEITIGGRIEHQPDGTTELVSEGSLRLHLLLAHLRSDT
jgi:hypothetical protein